jgi:hypothetical protein
MIAALYVDPRGVYSGRPDVECWGLPDRDAREYAGPWPVVAHPPCARWSLMNATAAARDPERFGWGLDHGTFASALASVRRWGGVLEHPAHSRAWAAHDMNPPVAGSGWTAADLLGGWTCCVEQGHWGHCARKSTWLYSLGCSLPSLPWTRSVCRTTDHIGRNGAGSPFRRSAIDYVSSRKRAATPPAFAEILIAMARSAALPPAAPGIRDAAAGAPDSRE